jgi:hypothetical protein
MLAAVGAFAAASAIGVGALGLHWYDQPAEAGYVWLSEDEARFVRAFAEGLFPAGGEPELGGGEAQLDRFIDGVIEHMPGFQQQGLKLLFHGIDALALSTEGQAFTALSASRRSGLILEWLQHPIAEVRSGVQSIVLLLGMGYTTHPKAVQTFSALTRCGIHA